MKRLFRILALLLAGVGTLSACQADLIKQSSAYTRYIYMQDSTSSRSPGVAGLTLTITASKAGAAFAGIAPTVVDLGGGWYSLALTSGMNDTLGARAIKVTATGADETDVLDQVVAFDPADAAALGLTRLDAAVSSRMATFTLPANFSSLAISGGGAVTVGTNNDKTGYSTTGNVLTAGDISGLWNQLTSGITLTGSFGKLLKDNLPVTVGNVTVGGYAAGQDPATLVLDTAQSGHNGAGSIGNKIGAAASAGDPWSTALPGAYASGTAGNIVGNNLNAAITTRQATVSFPSNFALMSLDGSGRLLLQPSQAGVTIPTVTSVTNAVSTTYNLKKNTGYNNFAFTMTNASGVFQTGLTVTAQRSLDGGAFASCTNSVTALSNGVYLLNLSAADLNASTVVLRFSAANARDTILVIITQN